MSVKNYFQTGEEGSNLKEASFHYVIAAFEEICEEDIYKVWKALQSHTKAHLRRMMAIEQLKVGEV